VSMGIGSIIGRQKLNARYFLKTIGSAGNKTLTYPSTRNLRRKAAHREAKEVQVEEMRPNLNRLSRSDFGA